MKRILLVEDDPILHPSLKSYLEANGFEVVGAFDLKSARVALAENPHLVVLDWMLPDGEGLDFLRELRGDRSELPVIFLTARADLVDRVLGLESGAQDYVTKPFEPRELVARIRARLREGAALPAAKPTEEELSVGPFRFDFRARKAWYASKELELTRMEFELLALFARHPGRAFTREELLNKVWGFERMPTTRTVDTHILMLRGKSDDGHFETLRGIGYRFRARL